MGKFKDFLNEDEVTFSIKEIEDFLKDKNGEVIAKGNKIIFKTDENRIPILKEIAFQFNGEYITDSYLSSIGITKVGKTSIIVKPLTKIKGAGGKEFEVEFANSLKIFSESEFTASDLPYQEEVEKVFDIIGKKPVKEVKIDGGKNSKRKMLLSSNDVIISPNDGETLTDITIIMEDGNIHYLSLKIGKSYTFYNGGVTSIMKDTKQRRQLLSNLGADYIKFEEGFNIPSDDEYYKIRSKSDATKFLTKFISECIGHGYIMVHSNGKNGHVGEIKKDNEVKVKIKDYIYPELNKRRYFAINLELSLFGKNVSGQFQLRNNSGKVFPNVIYVYQK